MLICFDPVAEVFVKGFHDSLSVEIVWIDKLHCFHGKFISLTMVAIEIGKKAISKLPQQWLLRGKKASSKT